MHLNSPRGDGPLNARPPWCHQKKRHVNGFSKIYLLIDNLSDIP